MWLSTLSAFRRSIQRRLVPVVLREEVVQRPLAAGGKDVIGDALDRLVSGSDPPGDVRFGVATLVVGERVDYSMGSVQDR